MYASLPQFLFLHSVIDFQKNHRKISKSMFLDETEVHRFLHENFNIPITIFVTPSPKPKFSGSINESNCIDFASKRLCGSKYNIIGHR